MERMVFGRWHISYDPDATRGAHNAVALGSSEECGCCHCLNFIETRAHVYPPEVLRLFDRLGIDFRKEVEVYQLARLDSGLQLYGGFFHFVGSIDTGADAIRPEGAVELE